MIRRLFPDGLPRAEPAPRGSWRAPVLLAAALAAAVIVLYRPAVDFRLLSFDDRYYTRNNVVAGGLNGENIVRVFTELPEENLFIPMSWLSLMADVELFGPGPRGFHLTNVVLHALGMALLLLVLWRMTGALWKSALAAAIVALHPLRVESVAWVTERKGVLSFVFLVLALACHLRYARTGKWRWYGALFVCAALGMLSKPILVTVPFLLLLADFWPLGRFRGESAGGAPTSSRRRILRLLAEKVPLAALSVLASLVTVHLQQNMSLHPGVPVASRVEHALSSVFIYLYETAWPSDLAFRYFDTPWNRFSGTLLPAAAGFALVTALVARSAGKRPWIAFGWGWYLVALFPVSGIAPSGAQWISDRFTHVPHVGLVVGLVWLAGELPARRFRPAFPALAALLVAGLALLSRHQLQFWKDGAALFGRAMAYNAQDPRCITQYAEELADLGEIARAREQLARVRERILAPGLGVQLQMKELEMLHRQGDRKGAIALAQEYLRADPGFWKTRISLADDLYAEGRFPEAAAEYRKVLEIHPIPGTDRGYALEGLALALWRAGNVAEARARFDEALTADPSSISARYNLARLLSGQGRADEALALFEEAARLSPGNVRIRMALAEHLLAVGAAGRGAAEFEAVARALPGTAEAFLARGRILEGAGMVSDARAQYEQALRAPPVLPDTPDAVRGRIGKLP